MNKDSRHYYRDLRLFLPIHGTKEKRLFNAILSRLKELNVSIPDITYPQICEKLGSPQEVVSEYLFNNDTEYLVKKLRFTGYIRKICISIILALLIIVAMNAYSLHQALEAVKNDIVTYSIESIE